VEHAPGSNHLCGDNFQALANATFTQAPPLPDTGIIYCKVDHVMACFEALRRKPGPYVVVTHKGDFSTGQHHVQAMPDNVVRWFTVGASITDNPRVEGIPFGIADGCYNAWPLDHGRWDTLDAERQKTVYQDRLLHVCFCPSTNPDLRRPAIQAVQAWTPCETYVNLDIRPKPFAIYLAEMHRHKFTLAPPGGGWDCCRMWEAFYLGVIPVCLKHPTYSWWDDLPFCFIDRWSDLSPEFLTEQHKSITSQDHSLEKLFMPYWRNKIQAALHI